MVSDRPFAWPFKSDCYHSKRLSFDGTSSSFSILTLPLSTGCFSRLSRFSNPMPRTSADSENTKVPARALPTYPQPSHVLAGHGSEYGPPQAPSSSLSTHKRVEIIQHHEKQLRQSAKTYRQFECGQRKDLVNRVPDHKRSK